MMIYDGLNSLFRVFRMRDTDPDCLVCKGELNPHSFDYSRFFGDIPDSPRNSGDSVSC